MKTNKKEIAQCSTFSLFSLLLAGVLALGASVGVASPAFSATANDGAAPPATAPAVTPWNEEFAYLTGMQGFVYGFPAIMYANLRYQWIESGQGPVQMSINEYWHSRAPSDPKLQYGGSPNRESYSLAFLDVSEEPVVLTVPENPDNRYYTLQVIHFYRHRRLYRSARHQKRRRRLSRDRPRLEWQDARWHQGCHLFMDALADGRRPYLCRSDQGDLVKMRAFQDGYRITPLSTYGKPGAVPAPRKDVMDVAPKTDPLGAFKTMNAAMKKTRHRRVTMR